MTTIAEFEIPAGEFALQETLEQHPDIRLEVDRVAAHDTHHVLPFIWASGKEYNELLPALESDSSVEEIELLGEFEDECLYRMEWTDQIHIIGYMLIEANATVQQAIAADGRWHLRVLFPERSGLSQTSDYAEEHEFSLDVNQIYDVDTPRRGRFNLSEGQHEALTEAAERGYYSVPREINQDELADALGISHQALSERLRRATLHLIETALLVEEDEESDSHPLD